LDFVTYHLRQVSLGSRLLNGGVILTGGGSQLKHLIQLTEYATGLNARIGLPNEHLAANHIDELKKPMYATCIGLILKGYNDYEHQYKEFLDKHRKVEVPKSLTVEETTPNESVKEPNQIDVTERSKKIKFWEKFNQKVKISLIDLFKEDDDKTI
ncbi:MAG: cell division protein FtsA, partial [Chitinophagaceae bacterium]|nr:cell division protein FtsA [Chitinophagaceae bacterium]